MGGKPGSVMERLMRHISPEPNTGCWLWAASLDGKGYGQINVGGGRIKKAYRVAYEGLVGDVAEGLELDHKCRVRSCCNPDHLEPVTHAENIRRRHTPAGRWHHNGAKTHCLHGHEFTPDNTYRPPSAPTTRLCRECRSLSDAA